VRGVIVNLGFYAYFSLKFQSLPVTEIQGLVIPPEVWALTTFVILYALAIALFKDIPDLEGDRCYSIRTLTVRLGPLQVFRISMLILIGSYALMVWLALTGWMSSLHPWFFLASQSIPALLLIWRGRTLNLEARERVRDFYQFIWKLFFLQYLLFPMAGWLPA
jgi:homogentisate phytyltransferase/homogentisate geranylgeranyltransferase